VIVLGLALLLVGYLVGISILYTIGVILLIVGIVLMLIGATGTTIGPRRYYW
jgi:Family of unknown function (DUF6131)